jgi:cytochrome P450
MRRSLIALTLGAGLGVGCGTSQPEPDANKEAKSDHKSDDKAAEDDPDQTLEEFPSQTSAAALGQPFTEEDQKLIDTDPETLSPEMQRRRSIALRRKIMQNPDSPQAKAILEGAKAIERGEIQIPEHLIKRQESTEPEGLHLSDPNAKPDEPRPEK